MSDIQLRPYQQKFISDISEAMRMFKHCLCQAQGGFGKTYCFSYLAVKTSAKGNNILILSNRSELLLQSGGSLCNMGAEVEYISPKHRKVPTGRIVVAMAQTLRMRYEKPEWGEYLKSVDLLIIDEAHYNEFNFILECGIFDKKWVLGFTATPKRSGKMKQMGLDYECIVLGTKTDELIRLGNLVPARYFTLDAPDLSKVEIDPKDGDYSSRGLQNVYDTPERYNGLVSEYKRLTPNTSAVCFCSNQLHAIRTCMELNEAGISAKYLISGIAKGKDGYELYMDTKHLTGKREDVVSEFRGREYLILVNSGIVVAGFDAPNIVNVIWNTATMSWSRFIQGTVRGSRPFLGKEFFYVLDFGGNVARHGTYEEERKFSLWHTPQEGNGVAPTKVCDKTKVDKEGKHGCGRLILSTYQQCPFEDCGFIFKTDKEIREIQLQEVIGGKTKFTEMSAIELKAYAELNNNSMHWVYRMLYIGGGDIGFRKGMKELGYSGKFIWMTLERIKKTQQSIKNV